MLFPPTSGNIRAQGRRHQMGSALKNADWLIAKGSLASACRMVVLVCFILTIGSGHLHSQCPDNGQTKIIKPKEGTGFYFYRFLGDSSFRYFLDGKTFSFNDQDDPGRTIIFIDDIAYESIVKNRDTFKNYIKGSKAEDILRAEAKQHQEFFQSAALDRDHGFWNRSRREESRWD